jgi:hypothetical protein
MRTRLWVKKKQYQNVDIFTLPKESAALSKLLPATVSKILQIFLKILKDINVNYLLGNFKNKRSFYAVWNKVFNNTCKYCLDYGSKPHQAVVDLDDFPKMSTCFPLLRLKENYGDMLLVLPYKVAQVFCLCAGSEVQYFLFLFFQILILTFSTICFCSCVKLKFPS